MMTADPRPVEVVAGDEPANDPDAATRPRRRIYVNAAQIAAAKLQITLDRKLDRHTPEIVKKIAAAG